MKERTKYPSLLALKEIIEETSFYTGQQFFESLVSNLARILNVHGVWVTEFWPEQNKLNALAFYLDGEKVPEYIYDVADTPCEPVLVSEDLCHIPSRVIDLFPRDPDLKPLGAVSYMGMALRDHDGTVLGHLALLDNEPMPEMPEVFAIFKIFASRAASELRRENAMRKIMEREAQLNRLFNGTSDAIIEIDSDWRICQCNETALTVFDYDKEAMEGLPVAELFDAQSKKAMNDLRRSVGENESPANFEGTTELRCLKRHGETFQVALNWSGYVSDSKWYGLFHLKDISRESADARKIQALSTETALLKEQLGTTHFQFIIGESDCIIACIEKVNQVGPTDANVLIVGETGTGKELFAKAIHDSSDRKGEKMVMLNCAALPSELIESELFGHVKGAYTGADSAREGRFLIADGGTLFLDEIAELPLALQAKLLRVIQEGTFERLGSSETVRVDVRIVAATHQDLSQLVKEGKFREDLFYRLNVFPFRIPPLRERGQDIKLIAEAFFRKFTQQRGLDIHPPSTEDYNNMINYSWPGNVRELQNVIERGIITAQNGHFNLDGSVEPVLERPMSAEGEGILTMNQIEQLEKENIIKALNKTEWRIAGDNGAAKMLGLARTTLTSKINKFGIKRVASAD